MKKLLTLIAAALLTISIVACNQATTDTPEDTTTTTTTPADTSTTTPSGTTPADTTTPGDTTTPDDQPVIKDYYLQPITSISNLVGTNWYVTATYTTQAELNALGLQAYADSIASMQTFYFYEFMNDGKGESHGQFILTVKDGVTDQQKATIEKALDDSGLFEHGEFTWETEGNNVYFDIEDLPQPLEGTFANSSITVTYPKTIAAAMKIGDGNADVDLAFTQ